MNNHEFAKNPNIVPGVRCSRCRQESPLSEVVHEEAMPHPHQTVFEGYILCPKCGLRTHNYYMPEPLRFDQVRLKEALLDWQREKSAKAWNEYKRRHRIFQKNYDRMQQKYKEIFSEEASREQGHV